VLVTWEGAGHVPYLAHRSEILDQTTAFLYEHLDLAHASARSDPTRSAQGQASKTS
jgi:hypothetical protein